ncbi:MAG: ribosome silencing factor [candidate division Zixibacteria bacterium 4484_93]|nr:MAG: ribosome silencing factor [candidate division Zixibacteria bacterium 4484_93]RKZ34353.1 MAG: ribosome silencing factor [bacterium]
MKDTLEKSRIDKSRKLAIEIAEIILSKKGEDVVLLHLHEVADFTDFFLLCSANSTTQVDALSDEIVKRLKKQGCFPHHIEGKEALSWVLIDYFDVIVHIMLPDARSLYRIEEFWGDVTREEVYGD